VSETADDADEVPVVKDRIQDDHVRQVAAADPGIVRDDRIARFQRLRREVVLEDEPRRTGQRPERTGTDWSERPIASPSAVMTAVEASAPSRIEKEYANRSAASYISSAVAWSLFHSTCVSARPIGRRGVVGLAHSSMVMS